MYVVTVMHILRKLSKSWRLPHFGGGLLKSLLYPYSFACCFQLSVHQRIKQLMEVAKAAGVCCCHPGYPSAHIVMHCVITVHTSKCKAMGLYIRRYGSAVDSVQTHAEVNQRMAWTAHAHTV